MLTSQKFYFVQLYEPQCYWGFKEYLDEETEQLIWMLKDFASQKWDALRKQMEDADDEEVGVEMHHWWQRQIRRFRNRLRCEYEYDRLERRLRREECRRIQVEDQLQAAQDELQAKQAELYEVTRDLAVEREAREQHQATWRCQDCNAERCFRQ